MEKGIRTAGFVFFILFAVSVFISKAPTNVGFGVLMLLSLIEISGFKRYRELWGSPYVRALLIPLAIGFVLSFFSTAGIKGPVFFLSRYRFLLLIVPFFLFIRERRQFYSLVTTLIVAGAFALVYGFVQGGVLQGALDFQGFHIIKRNSELFSSLCLLTTVFLFEYKPKQTVQRFLALKVGLFMVTALCVLAVLFIEQRGGMVGIFFGWLVYALCFKRKFLMVVAGLVVILVSMTNSDNSILLRIKSITDVNQLGNAERLALYGSGFPYLVKEHLVFGTGSKKDVEDFKEYFNGQSPDFQERYALARNNYGNFHNSYLQMAIEGGGIFLCLWIAGMVSVLRGLYRNLGDKSRRPYVIAALVSTAGCTVTFFFHNELYRYGGLVYFLTLFFACFTLAPGQSRQGE